MSTIPELTHFFCESIGREMMKALGRLEHLRTMIIRGPFRSPFPVSALSHFFSEAQGLLRFSIFQMTLVGSATDFEHFGRHSVARHSDSLQVFDIDMIHILQRPDSPRVVRPMLDPLMKALTQCQKLQVLLLGGCDTSNLKGAVTPDSYASLFCSKTIQRLSLVNFPISFHRLCDITKLLKPNDKLKHLCISCESMSAKDTELPEELVEAGRTVIQQAPQQEGKASLSSMLRRNNTLEKIILFLPDLDQDEELTVEIFQAVGESQSLKALYLGSLDHMTPSCKRALMQMLQKNFVLEEFGFVSANQGTPVSTQTYPCSVEAIHEMTMLLRLNKDACRGKLLQDDNATREDWVSALVTVKDDLSCIYHLISRNPTLLDPGLSKKGEATGKKRGGKRRRRQTTSSTGTIGSKRKRLYRAVKYAGISYR